MATIQGIYVALFGRPADPAGLDFYSRATGNGADLTQVGALTASAEFTARFAGQTDAQIITTIFQSLFDRNPDSTGLNFYLGELAAGRATLQDIAIRILDGASGSDLLILDAKLDAANLFTARLDLEIEIDAYAGNDAAQIGRDFIDSITLQNLATNENTDAAILRLFTPDEGGNPNPNPGNPGGPVVTPPTPLTFTVELDEAGDLAFDGTATNATITLNFVEGALSSATRGNVQATIIEGPISLKEISGANFPTSVNAVVVNGATLSLSATQADGIAFSGNGAVDISGSDGDQVITVNTSGDNIIFGGAGADTITVSPVGENLGHNTIIGGTGADIITLGAGVDTVKYFGTGASGLDEANAALAAREELKSDADSTALAAKLAGEALGAAQTTAANAAVAQADAERGLAAARVLEAVEAAEFRVTGNRFGEGFVSSNANKAAFTTAISQISGTSLGLVAEVQLKVALINLLPNGFGANFHTEAHLSAYLAQVEDRIEAAFNIDEILSVADATAALADAEEASDDADAALVDAQTANEEAIEAQATAENALRGARAEVSDEELAEAVSIAEEAAAAIAESTIDDYDIVFGFEVGTDVIDLPSDAIGSGVYVNEGLGLSGITSAEVGAGGILTFVNASSASEDAVRITSIDLLNEALSLLAAEVANGDTVAFGYDIDGEAGTFVFQGDAGADIAIQLAGVSINSVSDLFGGGVMAV
jgi:hypothetical protein